MRRLPLLVGLLALAVVARADRLSDLADPNYKIDATKSANLNALNPMGGSRSLNMKANSSFSKSFNTKSFNAGRQYNPPSYSGANKSFSTPTAPMQGKSFAGSGKTFNVTTYTANKTFRVPADALYGDRTAAGFGSTVPTKTYYGPENPQFAQSTMKDRMGKPLTIDEVKEILNRNK
jgi:hypothetical protein